MNTTTTLASYFVRQERDNGEAFYSLAEDRPEWLYGAVREAHDDELPNDWRYATCHSIAAMIDDGVTEAYEIADSLVDVYTVNLLEWLAENIGRMAYIAESNDDLGRPDELEDEIRQGQYLAIDRMAGILLAAIAESV